MDVKHSKKEKGQVSSVQFSWALCRMDGCRFVKSQWLAHSGCILFQFAYWTATTKPISGQHVPSPLSQSYTDTLKRISFCASTPAWHGLQIKPQWYLWKVLVLALPPPPLLFLPLVLFHIQIFVYQQIQFTELWFEPGPDLNPPPHWCCSLILLCSPHTWSPAGFQSGRNVDLFCRYLLSLIQQSCQSDSDETESRPAALRPAMKFGYSASLRPNNNDRKLLMRHNSECNSDDYPRTCVLIHETILHVCNN